MALKIRKTKVVAPACPLTACMAVMKGAWTPNIIWSLSGGPRRFGELQHDIPRVSSKVLSQRLRELQDRRVVRRRVLDTSPPSAEYELTELGLELVPAIQAIARVGIKIAHPDRAAA